MQDITAGKRIRVVCPYCNTVGVVGDGMLDRSDSMVSMHVFRGNMCEHDFEVALDGHYKAR